LLGEKYKAACAGASLRCNEAGLYDCVSECDGRRSS